MRLGRDHRKITPRTIGQTSHLLDVGSSRGSSESSGYGDILEGMQVMVYNRHGSIAGLGELEAEAWTPGYGSGRGCSHAFTVDGLPGSEVYPDAVAYTSTLPFARATVEWIADLLAAHQREVGTRAGRRALGCFDQTVMFLRWIVDATKVARLATDNAIGGSTAYRYLDEALDVVADQAPDLHQALTGAKDAGYGYVMIDGTLIPTDRSRVIGPTTGVDLWWSGKHHHHGANIQVITAPDGWPIWTSPVRPGREHDTTCARAHPGLLAEVEDWSSSGRVVLADLGYEGERGRLVLPVKKTHGITLSVDQRCYNALHRATRALAERGNALLKNPFTALRHVTISPGRIGAITAAALVILHTEHHRTA